MITEESVTNGDTAVIDRLDCLNRNMIKLRPDIREMIREAVREALSEFVKELKKPKPYIERGYRE